MVGVLRLQSHDMEIARRAPHIRGSDEKSLVSVQTIFACVARGASSDSWHLLAGTRSLPFLKYIYSFVSYRINSGTHWKMSGTIFRLLISASDILWHREMSIDFQSNKILSYFEKQKYFLLTMFHSHYAKRVGTPSKERASVRLSWGAPFTWIVRKH